MHKADDSTQNGKHSMAARNVGNDTQNGGHKMAARFIDLPICNSCCSTDYCNRNCMTDHTSSIVGVYRSSFLFILKGVFYQTQVLLVLYSPTIFENIRSHRIELNSDLLNV